MTVKRNKEHPPRPTTKEAEDRIISAFQRSGAVIVGPKAKQVMSDECINLGDILSSIRDPRARIQTSSFSYEAPVKSWRCCIIGILPDFRARYQVLLPTENPDSAEIVLVSIKVPY